MSKYPHIRWWSRPNKGQYATMNEGLLRVLKGRLFVSSVQNDIISALVQLPKPRPV